MKRKWDWVAAVALVLGSVACGSDSSLTAPPLELSGSHELSGQVMEEFNLGDRPSDLAQVQVIGGGIVRSAVTNANGGYILEGLPGGRFRVVVQKPGYVTEHAEIDLQDQQELNFHLMLAEQRPRHRDPREH